MKGCVYKGVVFVFVLALGCLCYSATEQLYKINELPMYGGGELPKRVIKANKEFVEIVKRDCEKQGIPLADAAFQQAMVGRNLFVKGDMLTAIKRFNQAWLLDQNCYLAFEGFAVISQKRGNLADAVKYYQTAIRLNPDELRLVTGCALAWLQKADQSNDKNQQSEEYRQALVYSRKQPERETHKRKTGLVTCAKRERESQ